MNPQLRKFLESIGLKANASDTDANRFWQSLDGANRTKADGLATQEEPEAEEIEVEITASVDADAVLKAERERVMEIRGIASTMDMGDEWCAKMTLQGTSVADALKQAYKKVSAAKKPISIAVGEDNNKATIGIACADAMLSGIGGLTLAEQNADGKYVARQPHERAKKFTGKAAVEICRDFLNAHGVPTEGVHKNRIAQMIFDRSVMGIHSTSDFPYTLANALNKSLTRQYMEIQPDWQKFCVRETAPDFKQVSRVSFGEAPNLAIVYEGGVYTEATIGERKEVYTLSKYGKKFALTWEAIVNDDLGAFARVPGQFITAARRQEDDLAFAILTNGTSTSAPYVMGDTHALFDSTYHGNLETTTAAVTAPTVIALNSALTKMATQTGISSSVRLNIQPRYILAPWALAGTVKQLLGSTANPASSGNSGIANIWQNALEPIFNARLDSASAAIWYVAADPSQIDTIAMAFLAGYESPTLETLDNMSPDKREYSIRHVVAAKALDWRGLYRNPGA